MDYMEKSRAAIAIADGDCRGEVRYVGEFPIAKAATPSGLPAIESRGCSGYSW